jgi:hypothetical protein
VSTVQRLCRLQGTRKTVESDGVENGVGICVFSTVLHDRTVAAVVVRAKAVVTGQRNSGQRNIGQRSAVSGTAVSEQRSAEQVSCNRSAEAW